MADKLEKLTRKIIKNYLPFVKVESQAKRKPKKEGKKSKLQLGQPKNYQEKREEARQEEADDPPEDPLVTDRKNFLYFVHLCNGEQAGVVFLLIHNNCPAALHFDEDGNAHVRGELLDDSLVRRLNSLLEMWGIGPKTYNPREHVCIANTGDSQVGRQAGEADKEDHQELLAVC